MLQSCRNPGGGRQHIEEVSTAEREAIKTLVHLHLAGWRELQAVFQDAEKHWKQLEEQQMTTRQMVGSLLAEQKPSMCVEAGTPLAPSLKPSVPAPRRTGALLSPPFPPLRAFGARHPGEDVVEAPPAGEDITGSLAVSAAETAFPNVPASQTRDRLPRESLPTGWLVSPTLPPSAGSFPGGVRWLRLA
ncbi:hypothetical protein AOLI_G00092940 [Acnodon oligacanthus]